MDNPTAKDGASPPTSVKRSNSDDPAPPYAYSESSSAAAAVTSPPSSLPTTAPTVDSPFNFPDNASLPPYSPPSSSKRQLPMAFPQVQPDAASPFVPAYAPILLSYGITKETWCSFLNTMSAFLSAKVSDRAVSHAADMAKHMGEVPRSFGKGVASHAQSIGRDISSNVKRGNIIGAAMGVIGGAISLPVGTVMGAVGMVTSLPATAIGAIAKKPQTPYERAAAYAEVANKKWLRLRGLQALILDTTQLAQLVGVSDNVLLGLVRETKDSSSASGQLRALEAHIEALQVQEEVKVSLEARNLWLVVTRMGIAGVA